MKRVRPLLGLGILVLMVGIAAWPLARSRAKPAPPKGPPAMIEMEVARVASTANNQSVVILRSNTERKLLPIWIGEAEANAIRLRLSGRRPPRPLTHDLLDRVIAQLGARLEKVHVEDLRDNTFYGRVFLRQGNKAIDIDARPSDSIALAVGARVPVIVARRVLEAAGVEDTPATPPGGDKDAL
jgi:uncharacterized protein